MEFSAGLPLDLFALLEAPSLQALEPAALVDPGAAAGQGVVPFIDALRELQALIETGQTLPGAGKALPAADSHSAVPGAQPLARMQSLAQSQTGVPLPAADRGGASGARDFTLSANRALEQLAAATGTDAEAPPILMPRNNAAASGPQSPMSEAVPLEDRPAGAFAPQMGAPSLDRLAEAEGRRTSSKVLSTQAASGVAAADRLSPPQPTLDPPRAPRGFELPDAVLQPLDNPPVAQVTTLAVPPSAAATIDPGAAGLVAPAPLTPVGAGAVVEAPQHVAHADASALPAKAEELAGQIRWMVDQKVGEARLRLHPPELGSVEIKISLVDDRAHVQMVAHNGGARDLLEQNLPRLRELLAMGGMDLAGASVSGGRGEQSAPRQSAEGAFDSAFAGDVDIVAEPVALAVPDADGQIDLYA